MTTENQNTENVVDELLERAKKNAILLLKKLNNQSSNNGKKRKVVIYLNARITIK